MSKLKFLHKTVAEAEDGDAGWVWWMDTWFVARIIQNADDMLFCVLLTGEGSEVLPIGEADGDPVGSLPWFQISAPPYEPDEPQPITHMLSWTDSQARWTFSWRMSEAEGNAISKQISGLLHELLDASKAEKLGTGAGGDA